MNGDYTAILQAVTAQGVQPYNQGESSNATQISVGAGVCRALVIEWLVAKKKDVSFWAHGAIGDAFVADVARLQSAVDLQTEYQAVAESRFVVDAATSQALANVSVVYAQNDVIASAQEGFAETQPIDEPSKIAAQVLGAKSRFFILSIAGTSGGHSIGVYRPYSIIGKSSTAYLFDPNIGEFMVNGGANLQNLLAQLNQIGYSAHAIDLNKSYVLWSFTG